MDFRTKSTTIGSPSTFYITYTFEIGLGKPYIFFLMDYIMSCVHLPHFSFFHQFLMHGSKDWWRASIFVFITCIWVQCLCCFSTFFCCLSIIICCPCICNSYVNLSTGVSFLGLDLFVLLLLVIYGQTSLCLRFNCIDLHAHSNYWITKKQKKNGWVVYNSTSNNSNLNNFKNRELAYVTIKEDQKPSNKKLWSHACKSVCINLQK